MLSGPGAGTHLQAGSKTTPTCPASAVPQGDRTAFWLPGPATAPTLPEEGYALVSPGCCLQTALPLPHMKGQGAPGLYMHSVGVHPVRQRQISPHRSIVAAALPAPALTGKQNHELGQSNLLPGPSLGA